MDLYSAEQSGITLQLSSISERLSNMDVKFTDLERNLESAMKLIANCYEAYRRAPDDVRRRFNQAFFVRILVDEDGDIRTEMAEPFDMVLDTSVRPPSSGHEEINEPSTDSFSVKGSRELHLVPLEGLEP